MNESGDPLARWDGFDKQEDANQLIQNVSLEISPTPPVDAEFLGIEGMPKKGLALLVTVSKSAEVHHTSANEYYARKSAQDLPLSTDAVMNVRLSKGLISYEDQFVANYDVDELVAAKELSTFLRTYSPATEPFEFLRKERLIRKDGDAYRPTYAGILLFGENPSAALPKKCAVKVTRYNTSESTPKREHLNAQHVIEGPLIEQIRRGVQCVIDMVESISVLTGTGFEHTKYPRESITEVLVNAVIHRDYNISDDVQILVFNNRIEIRNPGRLPGHITVDNILEERFARNAKIVRLLNRYPDPPNKDIGEGLNTAFQRMRDMRLKPPKISIEEHSVVVVLPHEPLANPEETVMEYLNYHAEINNRTARTLTGISSENAMKDVFYRLRDQRWIERIPGREGSKAAWRKIKTPANDNK